MRIIYVLILVALLVLPASCGGSNTSTSETPTPDATLVPSPSPTPEETPSPSPTPTTSPEPTPVSGTPVAMIEEISPNPAHVRDRVSFKGGALNPDMQIAQYEWSVEGLGSLAARASFETQAATDNPGTFTVALRIMNMDGVWSPPVTQTLTVLPLPPLARFTAQPTSGAAPLTVNFLDSSARSVETRSWDFGDGDISQLRNPIHMYTEPGFYTVSLTAEGPEGTGVETKEDYIEVIGVDFAAVPTTGYAPLEVQFADQSQGDIGAWLWSFGDGGTSEEQNPAHTYSTAGTYSVNVSVVSKRGGAASYGKPQYIVVLESPPVANFWVPPTDFPVGYPVSFMDKSEGTVTSWAWNFGDGTTSTDQNPTHTYATAQTYTVSLTVMGPGGSHAIQQNITVVP